jgi:hypothetical protein
MLPFCDLGAAVRFEKPLERVLNELVDGCHSGHSTQGPRFFNFSSS